MHENEIHKEEWPSQVCGFISQRTQQAHSHSKDVDKEGYALKEKDDNYTHIKGTYFLCSEVRACW